MACHLRKVGNSKDLGVFSEVLKFLSDDRGGLSSDVGVYFVKDKGRLGAFFSEEDFEGKEEAGDFAAARAGRKSCGLFSRICC